MDTLLVGEPLGDRPLLDADDPIRRLAIAVLLQASVDASQQSDPAARKSARAFLFSERYEPGRRAWMQLAGLSRKAAPNRDVLKGFEVVRTYGRILARS